KRFQDLALVGGEDTAALDDSAAVDPDAVDVFGVCVVDDVFYRIAQGRHTPRGALPEDQVGLGARRDAAEVVTAEGAGAGEGGRVEDVGGGGRLGVALDDLRHHGGPAHRLDDRLRIGIGAERHVHTGAPVACEGFHRDAASREDPDRVRHGASGVGHDL